ncbi:bifunctional DNA primase/polymerase [Streptomyces sp. NBC_01762]|uniref:bifunctional DNA primase/polymerase n=1 Tax=unclassified Streptomyces TaxID=2593676 RepID=UPI002DDB74EF|nr:MULTISPECIES: bifunctional DNA primase/polymerase [unclassified Streptomyces]WSC47938.1 bifunctional DNA primase/polymerase [Streptomyces sp. NBC_01762]WSD27589.1 bifunctional DNA primase/polymerase [Streptomyces sp. NBC_01751]
MTQPVPIRRERTLRPYLPIALELATAGVPVLPLREGKVPFGNCRACGNNACGGRPHMKRAGECRCPGVCHGWAAATTNSDVLASPAWAAAWREAQAVAYHPGGAGLTVVDLDNAQAVAWAHQTLPATRTVPTTRGEHWIYLGAMRSANSVRPGVDIKSLMAYARWLGPGTGTMTQLPSAARTLVEREETTPARGEVVSSTPERAVWDATTATGCRHTERYVRTGLERGLALVRSRTESGAGSQAFGVTQFLAAQHAQCPGPCGLDVLGRQIVAAAVSVGVPEAYAERAVTNGLNTSTGRAA